MAVEPRLERSAAVYGPSAMARLASARVAVIGVGGVGSWCAEALARTGVGHLILIDDDLVAASNLNRQCPATSLSLGRAKVEAMRERLLAIVPDLDVAAHTVRYTGGELPACDLVVDAIDSVDCKTALVLAAVDAGLPVISSMGAALRTDPTRVRVTDFAKVEGDGLARALRHRFREQGRALPKFPCVWSAEPPLALESRGSVMTVTATFGMCLAATAINLLIGENK